MKYYNEIGTEIKKAEFFKLRDRDIYTYGNALMWKVPGGLRLCNPSEYIMIKNK